MNNTRSGKKIFYSALFMMFMLLSAHNADAQVDPPDPCSGPDDPCPIDGALSLLIAAGIGLGAKKAYDRKKTTVKYPQG